MSATSDYIQVVWRCLIAFAIFKCVVMLSGSSCPAVVKGKFVEIITFLYSYILYCINILSPIAPTEKHMILGILL